MGRRVGRVNQGGSVMPAGRPTEISDVKIQKLEQAFSIDATIKEACFYADISPQTYYNWIETRPELLERFNALREKPVLQARQTISDNLKSDPKVAQWYLERKRKNEFSSKTELEVNGALDLTREKIGAFLDDTDDPEDSETSEQEDTQ